MNELSFPHHMESQYEIFDGFCGEGDIIRTYLSNGRRADL